MTGEPALHAVCHCTNRKRRTGSAFGVSAYFKRSAVAGQASQTRVCAFHNELQNRDQERHFCPNCGTTLFWYVSSLQELVGIAAGCFGEEHPVEPWMSVTHSKELSWVELPAGLKTVPQ